MISNNESSLFSLLIRKSIIDPRTILKTCHKNCMYNTKNEISTQCQNSMNTCTDEQTQVSQSNESKDTQTCYVCSPNLIKKHRSMVLSKEKHKYILINPYAIIDRVYQGEQCLRFLYKQNRKLDLIYTNFLKDLQKYTDNFLLPLQQEHCLYGIYRRDMIRYMIILQEHINELRTKLNILQEANKNFALFQKHFHKIVQSKSDLENLLHKHDKHIKQNFDRSGPIKYQEQFCNTYQTSYIQLQTIEQQRLLAIREQMRFAINLTMMSTDDYNLFASNNFDDLLTMWNHQHIISIDHWTDFSRRSTASRQDNSFNLLDEIKQVINEYYNHRQTVSNNKHLTFNRISDQLNTIDNSNDDFLKRIDSITSNITYTHI
ncbi:unnamed protein product [Rotaria socialis]|uniref:Uncharacterized protein n=1 Tax=Rotaria socialis TaxID=392032 RepID=A0A817UA37_9BILA|nr:unnamed protein product [Rotaria socialis]CAF4568114.1 unnamed protein product [Rotaria socialis]